MTFINRSLGTPVIGAPDTIAGGFGVVGAPSSTDGDLSQGRFRSSNRRSLPEDWPLRCIGTPVRTSCHSGAYQ